MHLIPFVQRGFSGPTNDHLLYQDAKFPIYVMDNHRLAMWCWLNFIKSQNLTESFNFLHIDAHPDLSTKGIDQVKADAIDFCALSLSDYRKYWDREYNVPLIRWDNYLAFFLNSYPSIVDFKNTFSATHKMGSTQTLNRDILPHELIKFMNDYIGERIFFNTNRWILNLDLDYFFTPQPDKLMIFSDEYIDAFITIIKKAIASGSIALITVALSPECCGSWEQAEALLLKIFDLRFKTEEVQ